MNLKDNQNKVLDACKMIQSKMPRYPYVNKTICKWKCVSELKEHVKWTKCSNIYENPEW